MKEDGKITVYSSLNSINISKLCMAARLYYSAQTDSIDKQNTPIYGSKPNLHAAAVPQR